MRTKRRTLLLLGMLSLLLLLPGCQKQTYSYNNLIGQRSTNEFKDIALNHNIPEGDVSVIAAYLQIYSGGQYASHLSNQWQVASTKESLYDYTSAITDYKSNQFEDINCRQAAYLLYHSLFSAEGDEELSRNIEELSAIGLETEADYIKYEVLFGSITSSGTLADAILARWKSVDAHFSDDVQLVSLWGTDGGQIMMHLHSGLLFSHEKILYFFEKTDPLLPYQASKFTSIDMLKSHLLNRTASIDDMTVFINDCLVTPDSQCQKAFDWYK